MSRAEHWFRWHHGTVTDPKWRVVALRASHTVSREVTPCHVVSVWAAMLECASQSSPRGNIDGWCDEDVAAGLGIDTEVVEAIRSAMQGKTLEGVALSGWNKRQPKAEDTGAARRKAESRERQKSRDVTAGHTESRSAATETETETETEEKQRQEHAGACSTRESGSDEQVETDAQGVQACPVKRIVAAYHEILPELPAIREMPEASVKMLRSRWRSDRERQSVEWWSEFFRYVRTCPFLMGEVTDFTSDLLWLVRPSNFAKVLNGNYEASQRPGNVVELPARRLQEWR